MKHLDVSGYNPMGEEAKAALEKAIEGRSGFEPPREGEKSQVEVAARPMSDAAVEERLVALDNIVLGREQIARPAHHHVRAERSRGALVMTDVR